MSQKTLIRSRNAAFAAQGGRCFYCDLPMWVSRPENFSRGHGVRAAHVWRFQCTAEHLIPREKGGRDTRDNIAAACAYCNRQRHRAKPARSPEAHREHVQRRLARGRWHLTSGQRSAASAAVRGEGVLARREAAASVEEAIGAVARHQDTLPACWAHPGVGGFTADGGWLNA